MDTQTPGGEMAPTVKKRRRFRLLFWRKKKKTTNTATECEGSDTTRERQPLEPSVRSRRAAVHSSSDVGDMDESTNKDFGEIVDEFSPNQDGNLLQQRVTWSDTIDDFEHMCGICYDVMARPHKLDPCSHVFCETCLRQLQAVNERRASARRAGALFVAVLRPGISTHTTTVDCPICRQGIMKCELAKDLDETIKKRYPKEYKEKLKLLKQEKSSNKNSKLPTPLSYPHRTSTDLAHPRQANLAPRAANQQPAQPLPRRPPPPRRSLLLFLLFGCLALVGGLVYVPLIFNSVGVLRLARKILVLFGLANGGREGGGLEFWIRARRDINTVRTVAFVLFLAAIKMWVTVSICNFFLLQIISLGISAIGFVAAGKGFFETLFEVAAFALPI